MQLKDSFSLTSSLTGLILIHLAMVTGLTMIIGLFIIFFSKVDSDNIRLYTDLATSQNDTYLYLLEMGIADMNQNYIMNTIQKVKIFTSDRSRPALLRLALI